MIQLDQACARRSVVVFHNISLAAASRTGRHSLVLIFRITMIAVRAGLVTRRDILSWLSGHDFPPPQAMDEFSGVVLSRRQRFGSEIRLLNDLL